MPNKTIYIRESDRELWEKAEALAGGSVSHLLTEALRRYVEEEERGRREGMENIQIELGGPEDTTYTAEFVGEWLLAPNEEETRTTYSGYDAGAYYGVALTRRGKIAVYVQHVNDRWPPYLQTYDSLKEARGDGLPVDILTFAEVAMDEDYVRKLDI